jgi:Tol biopolymer transport system component
MGKAVVGERTARKRPTYLPRRHGGAIKRYLGGAVAVAVIAVLAVPAAATPPGRNGAIVWQRQSDSGPPHLWVASPDGSGARQVFATVRDRGESEGTFSPTDPNLMFFTRSSGSPLSQDIYSGNLASGEVTRVTRVRSAEDAPTVSPDGTKIAYYTIPRPRRPDLPLPPSRIHVANLDGSGDRAITPRPRDSVDPDWSPDGSRIVYVEVRLVGRPEQLQVRLAVINADGTGRRALTAFGGPNEANPKWMPDGRTIVYERQRERGTRSDIVAVSATGGAPRPVLATPAWETNPVPSPDGTRLVFTSDRDRRGRERLGPGFEVYTMALDGSGVARLTNNRRPDLFPDWQRLP